MRFCSPLCIKYNLKHEDALRTITAFALRGFVIAAKHDFVLSFDARASRCRVVPGPALAL